jgi:two-component system sensor histidine kinase KdpD
VVGLPALTAALVSLPQQFALSSTLLIYLLVIVAVTVIGGASAAAVAAVGGALLANYFFTEPRHTFDIHNPQEVLALGVFTIVATVVATLVDLSARRAHKAARAEAETAALATLTSSVLDAEDPLQEIVDTVRVAFSQDAVAILRRQGDGWESAAAAGGPVPIRPEDATGTVRLSDDAVLALRGRRRPDSDQRILAAFAGQVAVAVTAERLRAEAADAAALAQANDLRTALLRAVSHDLRTPLSSIKASVTSLLQNDVELSPDLTRDFLVTINDESDRLDRLVGNLLDMGRLQAGALNALCRPTSLEEVVPAALASLGHPVNDLIVDVRETLPQVAADPALLERVIANVVANAATHATPRQPVAITAAFMHGRVMLRVVDHGPGIAQADREKIFEPFQRLRDSGDGGVGLGLAVARGLVAAMGATLSVEDTPGGGATMVITLLPS